MRSNFFTNLPEDVLIHGLWPRLSNPEKVCLVLASGIQVPAELVPKPVVLWKNTMLGSSTQGREASLKPEYRKHLSMFAASRYFGVKITNPADDMFRNFYNRDVKHSWGVTRRVMFRELRNIDPEFSGNIRNPPRNDANHAVYLMMTSLRPSFKVKPLALKHPYARYREFIRTEDFIRYVKYCWPPRRELNKTREWLRCMLSREDLSAEAYSLLRGFCFRVHPKTVSAAKNALSSGYLGDLAMLRGPYAVKISLSPEIHEWLDSLPPSSPWFREIRNN